MGLLEQLTPGQIVALVVGLGLAFCGAINTVGAAAERIIKLRQAVKAPNAAQDERLEKLEKRMDEAEWKLGRDYAAFQSLEESTAVTQRALLALLGHGLHGNNVEAMTASEIELRTYLTNHH
ncbi:MAG: hypothetical protein IJE58_03785 [Oscillospiraceae bacterium]|nr:hypothetical protein [Oscillospiraceae bacterium]